ncbi:hypothetical protein D3C75_1117870 [compost metagenome]
MPHLKGIIQHIFVKGRCQHTRTYRQLCQIRNPCGNNRDLYLSRIGRQLPVAGPETEAVRSEDPIQRGIYKPAPVSG